MILIFLEYLLLSNMMTKIIWPIKSSIKDSHQNQVIHMLEL
jgi:hypothetical protein